MSDKGTIPEDLVDAKKKESNKEESNIKPTRWGDTPTDWDEEKINEVTKLVSDGSHNPPERVENGIQILSGQNIQNGHIDFNKEPSYISPSDFEQMDNNHSLQKGDLLMTIVGSIGRSAIVEERKDFAIQRSIALLRTNDKISTQFLKFVTDSQRFHSQAKSRSRATAQGGLYLEALKKINIPVPPLPEQLKIATVLYNLDQAIQKIEEIIEQTKRMKKGLMQDLLSEGTDDHELKETGTVYGKLPESWEISRIGEIFEVIGGSTPSTDEPEYWNGDIPWATPTDITELESLTIDETERKITEEGLESTSVHLLPPYSLLLTSRATIGACAVNTVEMATNQGFQNLVPVEEDKIDIWYTYYRIIDLAEYLESLGAGSTFSEISNSMVKKIQFPVPPIKEQKEISRILKDIDKSKLEYINQKEELQRLKKGLMKDLLTGKVRTKDKDIEVLDEVKEYDT